MKHELHDQDATFAEEAISVLLQDRINGTDKRFLSDGTKGISEIVSQYKRQGCGDISTCHSILLYKMLCYIHENVEIMDLDEVLDASEIKCAVGKIIQNEFDTFVSNHRWKQI